MRDRDRKADMLKNSNCASEQAKDASDKFSFLCNYMEKMSNKTIIKQSPLKCESDLYINLMIK